MKIPLQITARDFELTEAIEEVVKRRAEKLDQYYEDIVRCKVVLEMPHRHRSKGRLFNVRIDLKVPGGELVVKNEPNEDLYVAVRDAFDAARRQIQDYAGERRGQVKTHEEVPRAFISSLFPLDGYGFLTTDEGREIYFHRNSVLGGKFEELKVGTSVRFVEERGEKGPQASTVELI